MDTADAEPFAHPAEPFDPQFFAASSGLHAALDPLARSFLETTWHLLEAAGQTRDSLKQQYASDVGVFVGPWQGLFEGIAGATAAAPPLQADMAELVAQHFQWSGPRVAVDSAAALSTLCLAGRSLLEGRCKLAVAAGIGDAPQPLPVDDPPRSGFFQPAHGLGAVLLKPWSRALADGDSVLAVLDASTGARLSPDPGPPSVTGAAAPACRPEILVLSANTPVALRLLVRRLLQHLRRLPSGAKVASLGDLAYTLQSCREEMNCRLALVVNSLEDLAYSLEPTLAQPEVVTTGVRKAMVLAPSGAPVTLYQGDLRHSAPVRSLLSGSAGDAMVQALLSDGDLESVALYWVQGGRVDWAALRAGQRLRKLPLPLYPFLLSPSERQWLEADPAAPQATRASPQAVESALTAIWCDLLGLDRIGRHQNFFELGGDSQLGMHLISRVRDALQVDLPLSTLYETPTLARMGEKIAFLAPSLDAAGAELDYEEGIIL
ncbi:beta-ketoacyl synthase N-terminal-like domain-containing protein [Aquabacterium sp. A7-Y]|uniref:beta-ketoacyl synthase N-terminal-like domain-containing protein n=1 Tax=Aquabacterium sp. A7-Y TaxID=1349605 RepID=UPI00223E5BAE|nr:beta-ketoacyl synthase N-terminal-like domain-containing protein [Aquabacterium sp. A7-Y]MCW7538522.1 beta-ketoacyl synthase N-terminal-like domain-containing protein [Aquabacterium sp. A7-Y]